MFVRYFARLFVSDSQFFAYVPGGATPYPWAMQWIEGETYVLIEHAVAEIIRRTLPQEIVTGVIEGPEQVIAVRPGRVIHQSRYVPEDDDQVYLLRVVIDIDRRPAEVVTAYRTSRVLRYWRRSE